MPPKPSFLALGDIHLDPLIWRRHRDITGDAEASWMSFIDHAINLKIPIVIVGDLFDSIDPPTTMVQVFRESMEICQANGVEVFAIQGNHDKRLPIPWYCAVSPHPRHFGDGALTTINGIKTVGIDYSTQDVIQERLATITSQIDQNPVQVLFLHQAVKQGLKFQDAWNCDINWVPDAIPLVILGDLHAPIDIPRAKGHALYTGSSHPRSLAEAPWAA